MPDYRHHWWYVERPVPWLGVAFAAIPICLLIFGVLVGVHYCPWWR